MFYFTPHLFKSFNLYHLKCSIIHIIEIKKSKDDLTIIGLCGHFGQKLSLNLIIKYHCHWIISIDYFFSHQFYILISYWRNSSKYSKILVWKYQWYPWFIKLNNQKSPKITTLWTRTINLVLVLMTRRTFLLSFF